MTLPTLTVLLDDGTGSFPFDITSKVLADGYDITRGRDDWISAVTAGQLTLTLNNSDGRFTTGSTIIATPSPIKVDQRIRVKETVNGTTYTRATMYAKSWAVEWPGVVTSFATVTLTATDAQARAERRTLRSMLEEETLTNSPTAYYMLSEATGSTSAGDTSGSQAPPLTIKGGGSVMAFGTGIGPVDGLPAVQMASGQYLDSGLTATTFITPSTPFTISAFVVVPSTPGGKYVVVNATNGAFFFDSVDLGVDNFGHLELDLNTGGSGDVAVGSINVCDGNLHHIAATFDGSNVASVYVDGVLDHTLTGVFNEPVAPLTQLRIGRADLGEKFTGTVSHVALINGTALSAGEIAAIAGIGLGTSESGTARLTRLAGYAGLTVGTLDTSLTTVPSTAVTDTSAQDAIQQVADAETGLVFIDGSGALTFHNRNRVASKTSPDLTLSSQYLTTDVIPVVDDQRLVNYVEATAAGTGAPSLARSATSELAHGRYPQSTTYLVTTDQEALDRGNWIVGKMAEPTPRFGTLTINLYAMTAAQASSVLAALDLNCWLRVTSLASQNPDGFVSDVIVESWQEQACNKEGAESWTISCNVVAHSLFQAWILGDSTYSVLGSTTILGY